MGKKKAAAKKKASARVKKDSGRKASSAKPKNTSIQFDGVLERQEKMGGWHCVRVPFQVSEFFGAKGSVRVLGTMNGAEIDRALIPDGEGGHILVVGTDLRKKTKMKEGQTVTVEIYRNPDPDAIDIPEELIAAIEMEPEAVRKFEKLTSSMKRNMAYWVNSGKLPETRAKRAVEILRRLMNNYPFGGRKLE
jgi:hypothetical protein